MADTAVQTAIYRLGLNDAEYTNAAARVDAANKKLADSFSRVEARADPAEAAARRLAAGILAVERAREAGEGTDTRHAAALARLTANYDAQIAAIARQGGALRAGGASYRGFGTAIQQAGFQVGDFAVQIASGTNPMRAFIQQGTQLISMFGPWGAVIGAAGAVVGALATSLLDVGDAAETASPKLETWAEKLERARDAMDDINKRGERTAAAIAANNRAIVSELQKQLALIDTSEQIDAAARLEQLRQSDILGGSTTITPELEQALGQRLNPAAGKRRANILADMAYFGVFDDGRRDFGQRIGTPFDWSSELKKTETATDAAAKAAARYAAEVMKINDAWMKSQESQADAAQKLVDRLDPVGAATRKLEEDQGLLLVAMANGIEIAGGYEAAMRGLEESYRDQIDPIGAFIRKTEELQKLSDAKTFAEGFERDFKAIEQFGDQAFDRIGSAITEAFATGQLDLVKLGDIGKAVMSELIQFAIQLSVINPFKNWLTGGDAGLPTIGSIFKSISLNSAIDDMILANPDIFHGGGIVGQSSVPTRLMPMSAFSGAPRLHGGGILGPDERPAILRRGEGVFTPEQMSAMGDGGRLGVVSAGSGGDQIVNVYNYSGEPVQQQERRGPRGEQIVDVTIGKAGAKDIQRGGPMARALESTYGLSRMGSGRG